MTGHDPQVELARANLHRIRGEYKEAEQAALSILREDPENAEGHTLMGDLSAERGELEQASEWYELALDLNPKSEADAAKLEQVRQRIRERDAAATAEQLGLSSSPKHLRTAVIAFGVLVLLVAGIAYGLGQQNEGRKREAIVRKTIDAPIEEGPIRPKGEPVPMPNTPVVVAPSGPTSDRAWLEALAKEPEGSRIVSAVEDPRSKRLTITFVAAAADDLRKIAAQIGRNALTMHADAQVTIRGVVSEQIAYVASVDPARLREIEGPDWDPNASWVDHVLTDEWPKSAGTTTETTPPNGP